VVDSGVVVSAAVVAVLAAAARPGDGDELAQAVSAFVYTSMASAAGFSGARPACH
jgi:hypothetical protein